MVEDKDDLTVFDRNFSDVLEDMASRINPKDSKDITKNRDGLGKILDIGILLRKGFGQAWQFISIIQALFIIFGLSEQVSHSLSLLGIYIDPFHIGLLAIVGVIFFIVFGMGMLLYGGSQRSNFLINQKQNPAQRMDYIYYKKSGKMLSDMSEDIEELKEEIDKLSEEVNDDE